MDRKTEALRAMPTAALKNTLDNLAGPERPDADHPLAGIVHYDGIGQVSVAAIRAELERRDA